MMGNPLHFLRPDFRGTNVHVPVDLHGIRRDDFPSQSLRKSDGEAGFSDSGGACQYN